MSAKIYGPQSWPLAMLVLGVVVVVGALQMAGCLPKVPD